MSSGNHHAYLKWPRLIAFNLNGALAIVACALSSRCKSATGKNLQDSD